MHMFVFEDTILVLDRICAFLTQLYRSLDLRSQIAYFPPLWDILLPLAVHTIRTNGL